MKLNIIGLGRLAKVFARLWITYDLGRIQDIHSLRSSNVLGFIDEIKQGKCCQELSEMSPADLTLIAVPDDAIEIVAQTLAQQASFRPGNIVIHCSGVLSSEVLSLLHTRGCWVASAHPMRSFTDTWKGRDVYLNTYCALEGDWVALDHLDSILKKMGFLPFLIDAKKKNLYHSAGVFGSNYLITLFHEACTALTGAGVGEEHAKNLVMSLMTGTLDNLKIESPEAALTGPLRRGDIRTISAHLDALSPDSKKLYRCMAESTLKITSHSDVQKDELLRIILKED